MRLEDQVVSLELAKRLKELGVRQESVFYWCRYTTGDVVQFYNQSWDVNVIEKSAAFTVAELGEMLPVETENWQTAKYTDGRWFITNFRNTLSAGEADTEADARAKMLIYLIENGLLTDK